MWGLKMTTDLESKFEDLKTKYQGQTKVHAETTAQRIYRRSDINTVYSRDKENIRRISQSPKTGKTTDTGSLHSEISGIQMDLVDLVDTYGKLNVDFKNLIGPKRFYNIDEAIQYAFYSTLRNKKKLRQIKLSAAERKGNAIEILGDKMAEVIQDIYEKALKGKDLAEVLQGDNLEHIKKLDRSLIDRLKNSYVGTADYALAEKEVEKLQKELKDLDNLLGSYENDVQKAKTDGDIQKVSDLTKQMSQILDWKHGVMDGKLSTEGQVSEIRRKILDSAEGIQSAKGAIMASRVNYQVINAWIDAMNELEIKYRHAKEDMIPVFKIQGKAAAGQLQALEMKEALLKYANISQRLMETNVKMSAHLLSETFELTKTQLYNPERMKELEQEMMDYMAELNQQKLEWAEAQQRVSEIPDAPHYAKQE